MRNTIRHHFFNLILIFVCISPNFLFLRRDIILEDSLYLLTYYIFFFLIYFIFTYLQKMKFFGRAHLIYIYLSLIIFLGFDKNLKLWLYFQNIVVSYELEKNIINYLSSFVFLVIVSFLIFKILNKHEKKFKQFSLFTILFMSLFNIFSEYLIDVKYKNLGKIITENRKTDRNQSDKNIIIFLDGLVGPGGIDDEIDQGIGAKKSTYELFKKYNFKLYNNAYSIYNETVQSIPSTLNFDYGTNQLFDPKVDAGRIMFEKKYLKPSVLDKESTHILIQNKFFTSVENKIFATKNRIFNFCNQQVSACYSLNHNFPSDKKYVSRFESLIKDLRDERSIIFQYIWRTFVLFDFRKEYLFITEKVFFEKDLNDLARVISSTNYETYLTFYMFPHSPFIIKKKGKNCLFSKYAKEHFVQEESRESLLRKHYQEIYCGNLIIDKFLEKLSVKNKMENLNILIISDTGMKIDKNDIKNNNIDGLGNRDPKYINDAHKVLFAIHKGNSTYSLDETLISSQELFSKYFNNNYIPKKDVKSFKVFDNQKNSFINFE